MVYLINLNDKRIEELKQKQMVHRTRLNEFYNNFAKHNDKIDRLNSDLINRPTSSSVNYKINDLERRIVDTMMNTKAFIARAEFHRMLNEDATIQYIMKNIDHTKF